MFLILETQTSSHQGSLTSFSLFFKIPTVSNSLQQRIVFAGNMFLILPFYDYTAGKNGSGRYGGVVVSALTSRLEGPGFDSVWSLHVLLCVCMGFLRVHHLKTCMLG